MRLEYGDNVKIKGKTRRYEIIRLVNRLKLAILGFLSVKMVIYRGAL